MTSGRAIDEATWFRYQDLRDGGLSMYGAAKKIGVSYRAASDFEKGIGSAVGRAAKKAFDQARTPAVIPYDDLCPEAKEAYDDIEVFARRSECGLPCCKSVLDGLRRVFKFGTEDCGFGCLT